MINSADQQVLRLLGYAQQEGKELARRHTWQVLTGEQTFTSIAAAAQTSAIPSDFDRFIDETFYNRTQKRPVYGPLTPQEWQFAQSVVSTVLVESFRRRGDSVLITPTPTAGETYAFEYVKKNWCQSSASVAQSAWAYDTDTGILSEELMTLGVVWRFKAGMGLDYQEEFRTYEVQCILNVEIAFGPDGRADTNLFVWQFDMKRIRIRFRIDGDAPDIQIFAVPYNPECDFTSVCDKYL